MILNNPMNLEHNNGPISLNKLIFKLPVCETFYFIYNIKYTQDWVNVVFLFHTYIGPIFINV